eukprot:357951-Chlamydomonas_euryale.AAC.7
MQQLQNRPHSGSAAVPRRPVPPPLPRPKMYAERRGSPACQEAVYQGLVMELHGLLRPLEGLAAGLGQLRGLVTCRAYSATGLGQLRGLLSCGAWAAAGLSQLQGLVSCRASSAA